MPTLAAPNALTYQPANAVTPEHLAELEGLLEYAGGGPRPAGKMPSPANWLPAADWTFQARLALRWFVGAVDGLREMEHHTRARRAAESMLDVVDAETAEVISAGLRQPQYQVGHDAVVSKRFLVEEKTARMRGDYQALAGQLAAVVRLAPAA